MSNLKEAFTLSDPNVSFIANKKKQTVYVVLDTSVGAWPWENSPVVKVGKNREKIEKFVQDYNAKHTTLMTDGYVIDVVELEE